MTQANANYHVARLLLVVRGFGGPDRRWLVGLAKLAKVDFLLRYPMALMDFMQSKDVPVPEHLWPNALEREVVESPMIRYRYGPWDNQYYAMIGRMVGTGLAEQSRGDRGEILLRLTEAGMASANRLADDPEWQLVAGRVEFLAEILKDVTGSRLTAELYEEFADMFDRPHRTVIR